jgi:hypothetical protein
MDANDGQKFGDKRRGLLLGSCKQAGQQARCVVHMHMACRTFLHLEKTYFLLSLQIPHAN